VGVSERGDELRDGLVVSSGRGGDYEVALCTGLAATGEVVSCRLRGRLKTTAGDRLTHLAVGDRVRVLPSAEEPERGRIEEVLPRRSELSRGRPGKPPQLIVVNIDQVVVVTSCAEPELSLHRLDRFLALAAMAEVSAAVVLNKVDLDEGAARDAVEAVYPPLGITVIATSCASGTGLDALDALLAGRVSVVVGVSGAGKSSLLNALNPGYALRTGEVMAIGKGRHTTTTTRLLPLDSGGWVADTPGIKTVALLASRVDAAGLWTLFPELAPWFGECQFGDCSHRHEPGCAVRRAVADRALVASRYESYVRLFDELQAGEAG